MADVTADEMLTTTDNPYDPHTQFDEWFAFDEQKGYCTCELLARIAKISADASEEEENSAISQAIEDILAINPLGIYKKV